MYILYDRYLFATYFYSKEVMMLVEMYGRGQKECNSVVNCFLFADFGASACGLLGGFTLFLAFYTGENKKICGFAYIFA